MDAFAQRLLDWANEHGRHDLPWQLNPTAYSVWVSEIMLQQTQVATVIPYFERFIERFPSVGELARADSDEVLSYWAGLGYYARARNLHRAARTLVERFSGEVPESLEELMRLPGIGRSTAGAILALARGQRHAILDGNAKRVLARYHAVEGWPGKTDVGKHLWELADLHTPDVNVAEYTQAIMDLGAMVCIRGRPACLRCPLNDTCEARRRNVQQQLPAPRPKRRRPERSVCMLIVQDAEQRVLLERRPPSGIWGGLFSLPEIGTGDDPRQWCEGRLGSSVLSKKQLSPIQHAFTHFDLHIEPVLLQLESDAGVVLDREDWLWYNPADDSQVGIPAPIAALLNVVAPTGSDLARDHVHHAIG